MYLKRAYFQIFIVTKNNNSETCIETCANITMGIATWVLTNMRDFLSITATSSGGLSYHYIK